MSGNLLFVLGATHHNAPLEVREKLALSSEADMRAELLAVPGVRELVILSTCNRVEIYGVGSESAAGLVQAGYCRRQDFDPAEFQRIRIRLSDRDAALHLFEVASGIDSQLLGENEIFGQVKDAYAAAQSGNGTGPVLNRVFQKAFQAAKHVRTHTGISAGTVSIANVAVDLASSIFGSMGAAKILVLGTGEIGEGTARAFRSRGAVNLSVSGRTPEKATAVASQLGGATVKFEERGERLADFDIVVCSTASPEAVLSAFEVVKAMRRRPARPLLLIDLAVPRDVEASAARLENVFLYNLDDLAKIAEENRKLRAEEIQRCRAMLAERADALWSRVGPMLSGSAHGEQDPVRRTGAAGPAAAR
ncbi:MAG TPA: glutamyl-tRNA reductase [Opitutaceae bacterium]